MILNEIDLFRGIDFAVMNQIAANSVEENHAKDTVLFEEGEKAKSLYILAEGTINLTIGNRGSLVYRLSEPGQVFGWSALIEPGFYKASGICDTDLRAIRIGRIKLNKIFDLHPAVGIKILRRIGGVYSKRLSKAYRDLLGSEPREATVSYG